MHRTPRESPAAGNRQRRPVRPVAGRLRKPQVTGPAGLLVVWVPSGWQWFPFLAAVWLVYEVARGVVVRWAKRRFEQQVNRFIREHRIPTDHFRHTHRIVVKEQVLAEPELVAAMAQRARREGTNLVDVRDKVRGWLDEIVPQFNLFAYYKLGYAVARSIVYSIYNVRFDQESLKRAQAKIPKDAAVVYVSNHRSNADFVVTGFMLSKSIQISYAVGEWARVWPLENLFRSFGSYFVRRGEKDPLYHKTLETYVQLITKQAVTQAMFPEGGLSRDGALRPVKLGLLDYMARAKLDPAFTKPLVFVPLGINFDRVFEDENMVREAAGKKPVRRRTPTQKVGKVFTLLGKVFVGVPLNVGRFFTKRLKKHGVCAIHFGEPVVFDDWLEQAGGLDALAEPDRKKRQETLRPFAEDLLQRIGHNVPVTPVPVACKAMHSLGQQRMTAGVDRGDMILALRRAIDDLQAAKAPFFTGDPYVRREHTRHEMRERIQGREDLVHVALEMGETEDLDEILDRALDVLEKRRILYRDGHLYKSDAARWPLVAYYANSLCGHGLAREIAPPVAT